MKRQVFLTVLLAGFHQRCASRLLAGDFRSIWHLILSFQEKKPGGYFTTTAQFALFLLLPREICLAKVAVGTHAVIVDIEKSQAVDDALRSKVVGISDILFDETLVLA